MPNYLEKSTQSLNAAKLLQGEHYYPSTVNRAYYAYFQYVMHVFFDKLKLDEDTYHKEGKEENKGSHNQAMELLYKELDRKDRQDMIWLQRVVKEFKQNRVEADYRAIVILQETGDKCILTAESIINVLKKHFK